MNLSKSRHSRESGNPGKNWIPGQARNDKPDNIYVVMNRKTGRPTEIARKKTPAWQPA
jgi:hypothetical protein